MNENNILSEQLTVVSHELRTPLTSIEGALSLILNNMTKEISAEVAEILILAQRNTQHLIMLVNTVLDIAKIDADEKPLELVNISTLIEHAIDLQQLTSKQSNIVIEYTSYISNPIIYADKNAIIFILNNLLSNAIKFSPPQTKISISSHFNNHNLKIAIVDQGCGIADHFKPFLFEKFSQQNKQVLDTGGLGLYLCKSILEKLEGKIGCISERNAGTTFYFEFPYYSKKADSEKSTL